jgi:CRP/FNR family transcriptional regulator, cyclic AMP receptor protein
MSPETLPSAAPMAEHAPIISILDADPDLGEGLSADELAVARRHAVARVRLVAEGEWSPREEYRDSRPRIGLLIIDGLLTRELTVAGRTTTELLGAGDIIRPWDQDAGVAGVPFEVRWFVHEPARIAVLDARFAAVAGRWPTLGAALVARAVGRSRWLSFQLAVSQVTRVDGRLLILFWQLAERWGRVGPDGVRVPLRLTHQTLGKLVGARRPSVTTALSGLARAGLVERTPGGWLLHGDPAEGIARLLEGALVASPANGNSGGVAALAGRGLG